jgi:hypothetical protein
LEDPEAIKRTIQSYSITVRVPQLPSPVGSQPEAREATKDSASGIEPVVDDNNNNLANALGSESGSSEDKVDDANRNNVDAIPFATGDTAVNDNTVQYTLAPWGVQRTRARRATKRINEFIESPEVDRLSVSEGFGWTWLGALVISAGTASLIVALFIGEFTPRHSNKKQG